MTFVVVVWERKGRLRRTFLHYINRYAVIPNKVRNLYQYNCVIIKNSVCSFFLFTLHNIIIFGRKPRYHNIIINKNIVNINKTHGSKFTDSSFRFAAFGMTFVIVSWERKGRQSRTFLHYINRYAVIPNKVRNLYQYNCVIIKNSVCSFFLFTLHNIIIFGRKPRYHNIIIKKNIIKTYAAQ